nr:MAG TPA: Camelysin metallo-endopeptidase [Caudoviricetes sp.]
MKKRLLIMALNVVLGVILGVRARTLISIAQTS